MTDSTAYPAPSGQPFSAAGPDADPAVRRAPSSRARRALPVLLLVVGLIVGGTAGAIGGYVLHGGAGTGGPSSSQIGTAPDGTTGTPPAMPGSSDDSGSSSDS